MNVAICEGTKVNLAAILSKTRQRDVPGAEHALDLCYCMSDTVWVGLINDEIACIWGLIPPSLLSYKAYLWLLTTDLVEKHKFVFVRRSQICVEEMLERYPVIVGHAQCGNDQAIRWLKWLGATFDPPEGHRRPFTIRKRYG